MNPLDNQQYIGMMGQNAVKPKYKERNVIYLTMRCCPWDRLYVLRLPERPLL